MCREAPFTTERPARFVHDSTLLDASSQREAITVRPSGRNVLSDGGVVGRGKLKPGRTSPSDPNQGPSSSDSLRVKRSDRCSEHQLPLAGELTGEPEMKILQIGTFERSRKPPQSQCSDQRGWSG
jgi:hypothetical protein